MGSNSYLLYPGGGILFKFSESDNSITKLIGLFTLQKSIFRLFFSHGKDLYLLGGYGFWEQNLFQNLILAQENGIM